MGVWGRVETPTVSPRERVAAHRARLRQQGLPPVQIWVPDVRAPEFARPAHEQPAAIVASESDADDQDFVDALSWDWTADDDSVLGTRDE